MNTAELLHTRFSPYSIPQPHKISRFRRGALARLFAELGFKRGAEVGVAEGHYSRTICESNDGVEHHAVDPWHPYKRSGSVIKDWNAQERCLQLAHEKLDPFGVIFHRLPSFEGAKDFEDGSLDYVYIDGDHSFDFVMLDLIAWSPKVRQGGIVAGHDYYEFRGAGVIAAVKAYTRAHGITEYFLTDEKESSFFWAKP
jgi:hypothetical protein